MCIGKREDLTLVAGILCEQGEPLHPPEVPLRGADVHLSRMWTGFQEQEESTGLVCFSQVFTSGAKALLSSVNVFFFISGSKCSVLFSKI
jgi:hypothetical protein